MATCQWSEDLFISGLQCGYSASVKSRKPKTLRKEQMLRIRVTSDQKEALSKAAERAGLDLSSWLRVTALRAAGYLENPKPQ